MLRNLGFLALSLLTGLQFSSINAFAGGGGSGELIGMSRVLVCQSESTPALIEIKKYTYQETGGTYSQFAARVSLEGIPTIDIQLPNTAVESTKVNFSSTEEGEYMSWNLEIHLDLFKNDLYFKAIGSDYSGQKFDLDLQNITCRN
ncbi:MAG TPA: hypothetical protein DCL41_09220 [Bdellovibrionales bacterium]|nr:hypothetical protein [Pseudobdellovibrionaceae bacterium]HAG92041.1 hypothetical protein [Bdellovibrionales bacterium]|tara:strand:- start:212 stop:649 length:438 start_codon:yes stop_codon:yes gene_type:complete